MSDRIALARAIAARSTPRFVEIKKRKLRSWFTKEEVIAMKQGRWAEKERERLMRLWGGK